MTDVIERLRAANPVADCPPPPIEDVWRRVETDYGRPLTGGLPARGLSIARRPSFGGFISAIAALTAVGIAAAAIALLGHGRTGTPAPSRAGSSALAQLHAQAGRLLSSPLTLHARARELRGLPIVINAWASWCQPCRAEFGRFALAAARDGRQVAFLGADIDDTRASAQAFLARHPVPYPSYQAAKKQFGSILPGLQALPTTIFIDRTGKVVHVHVGEYYSAAALERDIATYLQQPNTPASQRSSVQALIDELGVLRQPQTAQARAFNTSHHIQHKPGQLRTPPQQLLPSLTRVVELPDSGKLFLYVAPLAPVGPPVYGLGYHEAYPGSNGGGCCLTAEALRTPQGPGPDQFASGPNRHTMYFEIVPDGVARVHWVFPRNPIEPSPTTPLHPTLFAKALSVSVVVHHNVAAVRLPQRGLATSDTWYAADGHAIATYTVNYSIVHDCTANGRLTHPYTASQLRRALATMPATIKAYTDCSNVIRRALGTQANKPNSSPNPSKSSNSAG